MKLLQLDQLFALPLQSAIRAQNMALQETLSFFEQFGLEETKDGAERTVKTLRFKAERVVEERAVDPRTGIPETKFTVQPLEVSIPLLAVIPPPSVNLQELNAEFGVEIVEPKSEPIETKLIPSKVVASSLAPSLALFSSLGQANPTTMKVSMKIARELPEGMARLGDLLADLLSGEVVTGEKEEKDEAEERKEVAPKTASGVEEIEGIGPERGALLKGLGIRRAEDLIQATETEERIKELATRLGLSEKQIRGWREKAKLISSEESGHGS